MGEIRPRNSQSAACDWTKQTPAPGNMFVKWQSEPIFTAGGIARVETSLRWEIEGEVLAVGAPLSSSTITHLKAGDFVVANALWGDTIYDGEEVHENGETRSIMVKIHGLSDVRAYRKA